MSGNNDQQRLLLIEDDINKAERLLGHVNSQWSFECLVKEALIEGLRAAVQNQPDIVLLDMTLPNYVGPTDLDANAMHPFGGIEFLRQAQRRSLLCRVIVVTQFETFGQAPDILHLDDLTLELQSNFSPMYKGIVSYHASHDRWKDQLDELLEGQKIA